MKSTRISSVKNGFTLLEVLTVLTLVTTLVAIAVPAIQRSREAARSMTCRNRLKQIGMASLDFHNTHRQFPDAARMWQLLPYLEQQALHDALSRTAPFAILSPRHDPNHLYPDIPKDLSPNVQTFVCPSSNASPGEYDTSYLGNNGTFWNGSLFDGRNTTAVANGMSSTHWYGGAVRMADVYDGASNTAFFSETRQPLPLGAQPTSIATDSRLRFFWKLERSPTTTLEFGQLCADAHEPMQPYMGFPTRFDRIYNADYQHIGTPNKPPCVAVARRAHRTIPPSSHHAGGVNLLMVDGSIRFISDEIDLNTWQQLGSRDSRLKELPNDESRFP